MRISRRAAGFLVAFGVYSWIIWPTFLKNIWHDDRSWHHGATGFFLVHLVLTVVSLALGTVVAVIGIRAFRSRQDAPVEAETSLQRGR
jgi:biotin transporter BioY